MARALGETDIRTMADKVAKDFVSKKSSLHAGTVKMAVDEGLNPEQATRLSEAVNHATYEMQRPQRAPGEDIRFEKVDPKAVIRELNAPLKLTDPSPIDYTQAPPKAAMDISKLSSIPQEVQEADALFEKQASDNGLPPGITLDKLEATISKLATVRDEFACEAARIGAQIILEQDKFAEVLRQNILGGHDADQLVKCALAGRPEDRDLLCDLFGCALSKLGAKGYLPGVKVGTALPPEAISKKLKEYSPKVDVELINGSHPLYVSIDAISNMKKDMAKQERGERISDDKIKKLKHVLINIARARSCHPRVGNQNTGANR